MTELVLERRNQEDGTITIPAVSDAAPDHARMVLITPSVDEDYWSYRVRLSETQAILGFPKFLTIGIGFAEEEDWNTNLPYSVETEEIFQHIAHNKGDDSISDEDVRRAIAMVQEAAREDRG